jgi:hypothetical protein
MRYTYILSQSIYGMLYINVNGNILMVMMVHMVIQRSNYIVTGTIMLMSLDLLPLNNSIINQNWEWFMILMSLGLHPVITH